MHARLNTEDRNYPDIHQQWVFGNPQVVVFQPWKTQSWRMAGIFPQVSMLNLNSIFLKKPPYDISVVF